MIQNFLDVTDQIKSKEKRFGTYIPIRVSDDEESEENEDSEEDEESEKKEPETKKKKKDTTINDVTRAFINAEASAPSWKETLVPYMKCIQINDKYIEDYNLDELMGLSEESPFGDLRESKTKIDKTIRNAHEIKNNEKTKVTFTDGFSKTKEEINRKLEYMFGFENLEIEFNKINIYTKGSFFKKHQDTPREGLVGTCLITLPTDFEGGQFILYDRNQDREAFDFDFDIKPDTTVGISTKICPRACIFYPELQHEVKEVTKGVRISLSFYIKHGEKTKPITEPCEILDHFVNVCQSYMNDTKEPLGILLKGRYSNDNIKELFFIKYNDKKMISAFKDKGIPYSIVPVIVNKHKVAYRDSNDKEKDYGVYLSPGLFSYEKGILNTETMKIIGADEDLVIMIIDEDDGAEFTGNESRPERVDNFYYSIALVLMNKP